MWILIILLVIAFIFLFSKCTLKCGEQSSKSSFGWNLRRPSRHNSNRKIEPKGKFNKCIQQVLNTSEWDDCCMNCYDSVSNYGCAGDDEAIEVCKNRCMKEMGSLPNVCAAAHDEGY